VVLTRVVQIQDDVAGSWYEAFVDAHSGDVVSVTDFVAHATVSFVFFGFILWICVDGLFFLVPCCAGSRKFVA
jgi:hypothetical protein